MKNMRWILYFILAYLALAIQVGAGPYLRWQGAPPNLVLLVAVFIAVNAPKDAALLGCLCLGIMQDLLTQTPLGLYALSYGLVGMFVVSTQQVVYRAHPLTHLSLVLIGGLLTSAVLFVQGLIHRPGPSVATLLTTTIYTAILAPVVIGLLERAKRPFAFQPTRRKIKV
jgi:rod shape-determining protein MreD